MTFKINLSSGTVTVTVTVTGSRNGSRKYEDAILCEIRSKNQIINFKINISFGTVTGLVL